ncbi:MAG: hypothetical protein GC154_06760 [bacterium]|nr:hypothetical protein [bacterium]
MRFQTVLLALFCLMIPAIDVYAQNQGPDRWENDIAAFERQDQQNPPPESLVLFVGSSSIRIWDLDRWFPEIETLNRGFGGSQMEDSVYFFDRIVKPYHPRAIVVYAGDNDIAAGKTPDQVYADFQAFVGKKREAMGGISVLYIAVKPSIARWNLIDAVRETNRKIAAYADENSDLYFIDIDAPMIGEDGTPRKELFKDDGLHLNDQGYEIWTSIVKATLFPLLKIETELQQ